MTDELALPEEGGQPDVPVAPEPVTQPEPTALPEPEPHEPEETEELRVEQERYTVPKSVVTEFARATGRSLADAKRVLQTGLDSERIYGVHRSREGDISRREAEVAAREATLKRESRPQPSKRPDVTTDPVGFWGWTAERLEKLDKFDEVLEGLRGTIEAQRTQQADAELERQYFDTHRTIMEQKKAEGSPYVNPRLLANVIDRYGIADRDDLTMEEKIEAGYRIAAWDVPHATTAHPATPATPAPRPRALPPRVSVPRPSAMPGAPGGAPPGETLDQRRSRLLNSEVANSTWQTIAALERNGD